MIYRRQAIAGGLGLLATRHAAFGQTVTLGAASGQRLYQTTTSVGNGADTTEDVLQTYVMPAGIFVNIGDVIVITANGTLGATTDSKVMRIKAGGTAVSFSPTATLASQTQWRLQTSVQKRGTNLQTVDSIGSLAGASGTTNTQAILINAVDTGALTWTISGQNNTSSVAGSITCQYVTIDYIRAA